MLRALLATSASQTARFVAPVACRAQLWSTARLNCSPASRRFTSRPHNPCKKRESFFSPNPFEANTSPALVANGPIRATWRHSEDSSTVWAKVRPRDPAIAGDLGDSSSDPAFVAKGAVAWLKLTVVGAQDGPGGGDSLTKTTFIQRVNTSGGVAPSTGCASFSDAGNQAFVPYTADYIFYTNQ
jgi:hypothetical protein